MRPPRVVVTIHGIQTHGKWQKDITPYLARHGLVPYHLDYGWFNALRFFFPWSREAQLSRIRNELRSLVDKTGCRRLSVISHSFGTYMVMRALQMENGNLLYDRVVLTGSIVERAFDWKGQFAQRRVGAVRNERADADWVVSLADWVSRRLRAIARLDAGDSGRRGFLQTSPWLLDDFISGGHSEVHNPLKYEQWARFIAYPALPADLCERVRTELQVLRQEAAARLGVDAAAVRTNLFAPFEGSLRIVPGATDNMDYAPELDLCIGHDHGGTGSAFSKAPLVVVKHGAHWSAAHLPASELDKLHPRLRWVMSLPILSQTRGEVVGVVNVDGLDTIPAVLCEPHGTACQAFTDALHQRVVPKFQRYLDAAFRGDKLASLEP
ncbi:esterase/lipase family protein [Caldimonas sp. KR1-144]|uniref:esterase/lipase family protein n=1 Tax=Caldimonas sp. KR1-144 TaxID=3400911 RepID=UPI003BFDF195